jgi:ATP-binding cassette subfamily B multidrug efflux pump
MDEKEIDHKGFDFHLMSRLLSYLKPYWPWVLLTFVLIFVASFARQAGPYLTKIAVDDYIEVKDAEGLTAIIFIYLGLLIFQFVVGYAQSWATNMIGQWAMRDVRQRIFTNLQKLPLRFFDRTPIGRLMARNTSDVDALNELFTDGLVSMLSDVLTVAMILGFIFYMDVQLGVVTCVVLPLATLATFWLQNKTFQAFREARTRFARFSSSLQETISGVEVVQLFNIEERSVQRFEESNNSYADARLLSSWYHAIYFPFMEFAGVILMALVLWHGGGRVLALEVEWGVLVAMLQYVPRFFMPIRDIADRYTTIQVAMASSERIFELIDEVPESDGGGKKPDRLLGEIEFRNVWFAYNEGDWVLRDVSFKAVSGQSLALVGATGAGKSTIINLVCRFYDIQKGQIIVDGLDIRDWDVSTLRRRIGIVQQDVFLFAGDIESNISLGNPNITHEQVVLAAHQVNADRFINQLPKGYESSVLERGSSLSVGQRQLLSFARALANDPEILVLDEATANVDTETEMWIQEAVEKLMASRTSIVIAHRLSTIRHADKILVMHHGQLREEGRHEELLAMKGIYARLHQLQYKDV